MIEEVIYNEKSKDRFILEEEEFKKNFGLLDIKNENREKE